MGFAHHPGKLGSLAESPDAGEFVHERSSLLHNKNQTTRIVHAHINWRHHTGGRIGLQNGSLAGTECRIGRKRSSRIDAVDRDRRYLG